MGLCFQTIVGNGPTIRNMEKNIDNGWVWLVCRLDPSPRGDGKGHDWHVQGVGTTEGGAVEMCVDSTYFIGPLPLDTALPTGRMEWAGSYFPLAKTEDPNPIDP